MIYTLVAGLFRTGLDRQAWRIVLGDQVGELWWSFVALFLS